MRFKRVDVFNSGGSPLSRGYTGITKTEFYGHRVPGDWVSRFFHVPGGEHVHAQRSEFCSHSLHHFLPERVADRIDDVVDGVEERVTWMVEAMTTMAVGEEEEPSDLSENELEIANECRRRSCPAPALTPVLEQD